MKRPGSGVAILVGAASLAMIATLVVTLVPLVPCEECLAIRQYHLYKMKAQVDPRSEMSVHQGPPCPVCPTCQTCGGRGKITLLRAWLVEPAHEAE